MMNEDIIKRLLAIQMSIGSINGFYNNFNEKLFDYEISLVNEIDELLNNGYKKEEIEELIKNADFASKIPELDNNEVEELRTSALNILDIRYNIYLENKCSLTKKRKKY